MNYGFNCAACIIIIIIWVYIQAVRIKKYAYGKLIFKWCYFDSISFLFQILNHIFFNDKISYLLLLMQVFRAAEVPIEWEEHYVGDQMDPRTQSFLTWESLESVRRNRVGLKGPMATPIGKGHRSLNLTLRKELNLYANVRPCNSLPGYKTRYDDVNLITIRENTEGEYSGLEHQVSF